MNVFNTLVSVIKTAIQNKEKDVHFTAPLYQSDDYNVQFDIKIDYEVISKKYSIAIMVYGRDEHHLYASFPNGCFYYLTDRVRCSTNALKTILRTLKQDKNKAKLLQSCRLVLENNQGDERFKHYNFEHFDFS